VTSERIVLIDRFRDSSRIDMLNTLYGYELEMRTTTNDERRELLQELLKELWREYLSE
jgi:hypothetical protein